MMNQLHGSIKSSVIAHSFLQSPVKTGKLKNTMQTERTADSIFVGMQTQHRQTTEQPNTTRTFWPLL